MGEAETCTRTAYCGKCYSPGMLQESGEGRLGLHGGFMWLRGRAGACQVERRQDGFLQREDGEQGLRHMHTHRAFREEQVCDWIMGWGRGARNESGDVDGWRPALTGPGNASYFIFSCSRPTGRERPSQGQVLGKSRDQCRKWPRGEAPQTDPVFERAALKGLERVGSQV